MVAKNVVFREYRYENLPPFYIGTDADADDEHSKVVRGGIAQFDPHLRFAARMIRAGEQFVDIGANLGHFTLALAAVGARVLAVEALPVNHAILIQSVLKNNFTNVTAIHAAIYETTGLLHIGGFSAWGHVCLDSSGIEVPSLTVDDLCAAYGFRNPRMIKMDIEGSELAALRGGVRTFGSNKNLLVIFEANAYAAISFGYDMRALFEAFEQRGFSLHMFWRNILVPKTSSDFQEIVSTDYIATRNPAQLLESGFEIRPLTLEEQISIVLEQAAATQAAHRAYIYAYEHRMPKDLRRAPQVVQAIERLSHDVDPTFLGCVRGLRSI